MSFCHTPFYEIKPGEQYIKAMIYSSQSYYLDCVVNGFEIWTVHHSSPEVDNKTTYYKDNMDSSLTVDEFIRLVADKTPKYLFDALVLISDPNSVLEDNK